MKEQQKQKEKKVFRPKVPIRIFDKHQYVLTYLKLYNVVVPESKQLSLRELEVLSFILLGDLVDNPFTGTSLIRMTKFFDVAKNTLRVYRRGLVLKGWIDNKGTPLLQVLLDLNRCVQKEIFNMQAIFNIIYPQSIDD